MSDPKSLTQRNFVIAKDISSIVSEITCGVVLSGSNAWGGGYAVSESSDIDLLIIVDDYIEGRKVIELLIKDKLVPVIELKRYVSFLGFNKQNEADVFSLISVYQGVKLSIDIMDIGTAHKICNLQTMRKSFVSGTREGAQLRIVREFRANKPQECGYSVDDLVSDYSIIYHPTFREVGIVSVGQSYIAESLVDGITASTYLMGVYSFYLSVNPVILSDSRNTVLGIVEKLQTNIGRMIGYKPITNVTRKHSMSTKAFAEFKKTIAQYNV